MKRNPRELVRWVVAAAVVLGVHGGALIYLFATHEPEIVGSNVDAITVELAPINSTPDAVERDVAPAPETMVESQPLPDMPREKPQEEVQTEQPPPDEAPAVVPLPDAKPPEKVEVSPPPAPITAQKVKGGAPKVEPSWQTNLMRQLQRVQALSSLGAIAEGRRRRAIELQLGPRRPCAGAQHRPQFRLRRSRRRSDGDDQARRAAAAVPGEHDTAAHRSHRADPLFPAMKLRRRVAGTADTAYPFVIGAAFSVSSFLLMAHRCRWPTAHQLSLLDHCGHTAALFDFVTCCPAYPLPNYAGIKPRRQNAYLPEYRSQSGWLACGQQDALDLADFTKRSVSFTRIVLLRDLQWHGCP